MRRHNGSNRSIGNKRIVAVAGIIWAGLFSGGMFLTAGEINVKNEGAQTVRQWPDFTAIPADDPLVQVTDSARVVRTPETVKMDRFIQADGGFQHDNPGARIRFRTDADRVSARLIFTDLHSRQDAVNSKGLYAVDGQMAGSFQRDGSLSEVTVSFPQNDEKKPREYELIMPYGDSVEFAGLSISNGKLLPATIRPAFKYVAFGDSITHGFRAEDVSKTYPFIIGEKMKCQVVNMGFGSRGTVPSDGQAIAACKGDLISILIGFNDFYKNKPLENYERDIKMLIQEIRIVQPDTPVFLITPLWSSEPAWAASKIGLTLEDYRGAVRRVVAESKDTNLHLIDGLSLMDHRLEVTTDGIHPNDQGFAQIAERLSVRLAGQIRTTGQGTQKMRKKILLLGDSIRMGYQPYVQDLLRDEAEVWGPDENCAYALYTATRLQAWLKQFGVPDLVHWNNGLHDLGYNSRRGPVQFSTGDYVSNLEEILKQLQATGAKIIWATTTPVSKIPAQIPYWSFDNEDIKKYNAAASEFAMRRNLIINDLYALLNGQEQYFSEDRIHLNPEGLNVLAQQVASVLRSNLTFENKTKALEIKKDRIQNPY
jgi:lysophospholipase L1-like esterase